MDVTKYSDLLHRLVSGIAYEPVRIAIEFAGVRRITFRVNLAPDDMRIVMGRKASVIKSIQILFRQIAFHNQFDSMLVILNSPEYSANDHPHGGKDGYNEDRLLDLITELMEALGTPIVHSRVEPIGACMGFVIFPAAAQPIMQALHTVIEAYGRSYGQRIGIFADDV